VFNKNENPDERGTRLPPFDPGEIQFVSVDLNHGGDDHVPVFTRFLRRQEAPPKSCIICTDDIFDIHTGSAEEWNELCSDFPGDWMWDILQSPVSLELECRHREDFCAACLRSHLRAQLEQHGRGGADRLSCPAPDCGRKLSYQEIRLHADHDTFMQYDNYLQLEALSRMPNFRRCLGPNCGSGQLYKGDDADDDDDESGPENPYIRCEDCGFEMCFGHSVPWHAGVTCEQYDNVREHGDPDFVKTRAWISMNTKPCPGPGCGENIQKGECCFHMTCE
jgi:hypothetical protein